MFTKNKKETFQFRLELHVLENHKDPQDWVDESRFDSDPRVGHCLEPD